MPVIRCGIGQIVSAPWSNRRVSVVDAELGLGASGADALTIDPV
jgi:hypothetical protein